LIELLKHGAVGVLPTDTVYGLVCRAQDQEAVKRLYQLKDRQNMPGTLIAANIDQLVSLGIKPRYLKAVQQFWPGPISVETVHDITYLSQGTGRQAIRIPDYPDLLNLMTLVGPLQTTSANAPGMPTAENFSQAVEYFHDKIDFYVDIGDLGERLPSTVIRIVDGVIDVVRPGAVKFDEFGALVQNE
jgi:L-threonylcarbamoyladenylate synthase